MAGSPITGEEVVTTLPVDDSELFSELVGRINQHFFYVTKKLSKCIAPLKQIIKKNGMKVPPRGTVTKSDIEYSYIIKLIYRAGFINKTQHEEFLEWRHRMSHQDIRVVTTERLSGAVKKIEIHLLPLLDIIIEKCSSVPPPAESEPEEPEPEENTKRQKRRKRKQGQQKSSPSNKLNDSLDNNKCEENLQISNVGRTTRMNSPSSNFNREISPTRTKQSTTTTTTSSSVNNPIEQSSRPSPPNGTRRNTSQKKNQNRIVPYNSEPTPDHAAPAIATENTDGASSSVKNESNPIPQPTPPKQKHPKKPRKNKIVPINSEPESNDAAPSNVSDSISSSTKVMVIPLSTISGSMTSLSVNDEASRITKDDRSVANLTVSNQVMNTQVSVVPVHDTITETTEGSTMDTNFASRTVNSTINVPQSQPVALEKSIVNAQTDHRGCCVIQ